VPLFKNIIPALLTPLLWFNLAGMAMAAVWLGALSQWQVLWLGVLMVIFSPYVIPILMIPAGIFSHFMALHQKAGNAARERWMFLAAIAYVVFFLSVWCAGIFTYVTHVVVRPEALLAALLWAGSSSMAPLLMWSSRDRGNVFIMTLVEAAQPGVWILCVARVLLGAEVFFWASYIIFGVLMGGVAAAQRFYEKKQEQKAR
jgi:hypothetical protein